MADEVQEALCVNCLNEVIKLITVECGHTICVSCLRKNTSPSSCCTTCWEFSQLRAHQVDIAMYPEGEGICEIHREDQKLFCDRNKTLLCVTCSKSESHENHIHWPIAVAALCYRKKMQKKMEILYKKVKIVQKILLKEKEQPLVWAVVWNAYTNRGIFQKQLKQIWQYLTRKKTVKGENVILEKENKKFCELNQRLKEIEATQEQQIMEEKKKWEALISSQSRFLTAIITELKEKMEKPDVEMLHDVTETLERSHIELNLKPFVPTVDASYITVVTKLLKIIQRQKLSEKRNFYNLSEEKKRAIRIVPGFSGNTYFVYMFGSIHNEDIRGRTFFIHN